MLFLLPLFLGCQSVEEEEQSCWTGVPEPGEVWAREILCDENIPVSSEALSGDVLLANEEVYAIFRMHPSSQYFLHLAGGSLVDMGFWDEAEELAEAFALLDAHWFEGPHVEWGVDDRGAFFRLSGTTEAVHFLDSIALGTSEQTVEWRLGKEGGSIEASGANGILFLGEEGGEVDLQGGWRGRDTSFSGGDLLEDLGGAVLWEGALLSMSSEGSVSEDEIELEATEGLYSDAVRVRIGVDVFPSRESRKRIAQAAEEALGEGSSLLIVSSVDEVASGSIDEEWPIRVVLGSETRSATSGRVWTWPWTPKSHKPAHGAAAWEELSPQEVLASAKNGAAGRRAMVDMDWVESAGSMANWTIVPELVWIASLEDGARVRELWQAGAGLGFASEYTWLPVESAPLPALSTMERELYWGQSSVSSGPALWSFRESTDSEEWDSVRFVLRGSSDSDSLQAMLWSATELLDEAEVSAVDGAFHGAFLAPVDQDVWVGLKGESAWALSSVHPASFVPEPACTGMSESDAVFDGNAL